MGSKLTVKIVKLYGGTMTVSIDRGRHRYHWVEEDKPLDGVTSILRKTSDKSNLINWAGRCAAQHIRDTYKQWEASSDGISGLLEPTTFYALCEEAETAHTRISEKATGIGKLVHSCAEAALVDGRAVIPSDPQAAKGVQAFLSWRAANKVEPYRGFWEFACEKIVASKRWYYAGTTDFVGYVNGELCVLDFKTSKPFYTENGGPYPEMHKQLAAYAVALEEEFGEAFKAGWIVRLDKDTGACETHRIELNNLVKDAWLRARELEDLDSKIEDQGYGIRKQRAA